METVDVSQWQLVGKMIEPQCVLMNRTFASRSMPTLSKSHESLTVQIFVKMTWRVERSRREHSGGDGGKHKDKKDKEEKKQVAVEH